MIRKIFLLILTVTLLGLDAEAGLEAVKGKVEGGYDFWLHTPDKKEVPTTDSVAQGMPMIIFLHGASLCGRDLDKVRRYGTINAIEKGRDIDAYVVAPQNPGGSWKPEKVMKVAEYVMGTAPVDTNRIYVIGMSLGGYGAIDFAATYPDRVAAAAGICGGASVSNLSGLAEVPLWIVHGTADRAVTIAQSDKVAEAVRRAQKDGVDRLAYERVPGMNHSQPARILYNGDTYEWLLSHRLDTPGRPINEPPAVDKTFLGKAYDGLDSSKGYKSKSSGKRKAKSSAKKRGKKKRRR